MKQTKRKSTWKPFIRFFTKFPIPWWIYVIGILLGIVGTELALRVTRYAVQIDAGDLYNRVILWWVVYTILSSFVAVAQSIAYSYAAEKITYRVRNLLWDKVLHLRMPDLDDKGPSSMISSMVNEVGQASETISMVCTFFTSAYSVVRSYIVLYQYSATVSNSLLFIYPIAVAVFVISGRIMFRTVKLQYRALNDMTSFFAEHIRCAKHVKAQTIEEQEIGEGSEVIKKRFKTDVKFILWRQLTVLLYSVYDNISMMVAPIVGAREIEKGNMEQTGINNTRLYANDINRYMAEVLSQYTTVKGAQGALSAVNDVLELPSEELEKGEPWQESEDRSIVLENVSFSYDAETEILHDICVRIPYGKRVALIGNNGCGKTTLLRLLQGLYPVTSGSITIAGNAVGQVKLSEIRKRLNCLQQDCGLFSTTIRDNIAYGMEGEVSEEMLIRAAEAADIHSFISSLPDGYDTAVEEGGTGFSGGQRQRIAMARAFLRDSDYLLLDEAGANLDKKSYNKIWDAFCEKMEGRSLIYIAHDLSEIQKADFILVLNNGYLEAAGTLDQVAAQSETYRSYLSATGKQGV